MHRLNNTEFFTGADGKSAMMSNGQVTIQLTANSPMVPVMADWLKSNRPKSYLELKSHYKNDFRIVRQAVKCMFGSLDGMPDISGDFVNYEVVHCPLRGEELCPFSEKICNPASEHNLSFREVEVAKLIATGSTDKEVAEQLFLSVHTVSNHRKHIFKKLNLRSKQDLTKYVIDHNI